MADTDTTPATDSGLPPQTVTASCEPHPDHTLRFTCEVVVDPPGPVVLSWGEEDGPLVRYAQSPAVAAQHSLTLWGIHPSSTWRFEASAERGHAEGTVTTGPLPDDLDAGTVVTGTSTAEAFMLPIHCAESPTLGIFDSRGQVLAYQRYEGTSFRGFTWTDAEGLLLAVVDYDEVWAHTPWGEQVLHLSRAEGHFEGPLHHDLFRAPSGLTYLIEAGLYPVGDVDLVLDSVLVFDGLEEVGRWSAADHVPIDVDYAQQHGGGFWKRFWPGSIDYTHTNSVTVDDDGVMVLSFRNLNAVYQIAADPTAPDFGSVHWTLVGQPDSPVPSELEITSVGQATDQLEFSGQHHPSLALDGSLGLFDNRANDHQPSRALFFDIDESSGTADIGEVYQLRRHCPHQGGAYGLPSGNRLVTCAASRRTLEFEPGGADPVFTLRMECGNPVRRAYPIILPNTL